MKGLPMRDVFKRKIMLKQTKNFIGVCIILFASSVFATVDTAKNQDVYINGDGETTRDFCYIDNTVQINLLAATVDNDDATDQVYNVALNDRTSLNKLYQMIEERLIQRIQGLEKKEPIYQDFRVGDVRHSQANIDKAQALLEYQPKYMISEGMDEAMDWYVGSLS